MGYFPLIACTVSRYILYYVLEKASPYVKVDKRHSYSFIVCTCVAVEKNYKADFLVDFYCH